MLSLSAIVVCGCWLLWLLVIVFVLLPAVLVIGVCAGPVAVPTIHGCNSIIVSVVVVVAAVAGVRDSSVRLPGER